MSVVAALCAVILRGRWPQAGKYWTPDACLVRVTSRHIAWSGRYFEYSETLQARSNQTEGPYTAVLTDCTD